jgi:hypothetical protein
MQTLFVLKTDGLATPPNLPAPRPPRMAPPPVSFAQPAPSPTTTGVSAQNQTALIQKLLQQGAFIVGKMPNDDRSYLVPSGGMGLQPFQVVLGPAMAQSTAAVTQVPAGVSTSAGHSNFERSAVFLLLGKSSDVAAGQSGVGSEGQSADAEIDSKRARLEDGQEI